MVTSQFCSRIMQSSSLVRVMFKYTQRFEIHDADGYRRRIFEKMFRGNRMILGPNLLASVAMVFLPYLIEKQMSGLVSGQGV